jgi:hypothetical protein
MPSRRTRNLFPRAAIQVLPRFACARYKLLAQAAVQLRRPSDSGAEQSVRLVRVKEAQQIETMSLKQLGRERRSSAHERPRFEKNYWDLRVDIIAKIFTQNFGCNSDIGLRMQDSPCSCDEIYKFWRCWSTRFRGGSTSVSPTAPVISAALTSTPARCEGLRAPQRSHERSRIASQ